MMQRLLARMRLWEEAIAGIDDPQGEYLLNLEKRVHRLEGEVEQLRKLPSGNAAASGTESSIVSLQQHKHNTDPRA